MAYPYNVADWYWKVGDTNPTTHRFSSASGTYVVLADATYAAWVAAGNTATVIDTEAHLYVVINSAANDAWKGRGWTYALYSQSSTLTLTNPVANYVAFVAGGAARDVVMPAQNMPNSIPIGQTIQLRANVTGNGINRVLGHDGVSVILEVANARLGSVINLTPVTNDTANGVWVCDVVQDVCNMQLHQILAGQNAAGPFTPPQTQDFYQFIADHTEDTSPDAEADFVVTYDVSAATSKKVKVKNLTKSETINTTYDLTTASGTQDITGFGFNPKSVAISFSINAGTCGGVGYASSSGNQGCSVTTTDSGTTWIHQTSLAIQVSNAAATAYQLGTVSFITDGIRITWAKTGSPSGTLGMTVLGHR